MHNAIHLLDVRGLLINAWNSGQDPNAVTDEKGNKILTVEYGLATFYDKVLEAIFSTYSCAPRDLIAVWDSGNAYRLMRFPAYKQNRIANADPPESVRAQRKERLFGSAESLLTAIGVTSCRLENEEADDLLAFLAWTISRHCPVVIHTVDHDLLQCKAYPTVHPIEVSIAGDVTKEHRNGGSSDDVVPVDLIALHKSLVGDTTDEYGGFPNFGKKAWSGMVEKFGFDGMRQLRNIVAKKDWDTLREAISATGDRWLSALYQDHSTWELMYDLACLHPELATGVRDGKVVGPKWSKKVPNYVLLSEAYRGLPEEAAKAMRTRVAEWMPRVFLVDGNNGNEVLQDFANCLPDTPFVAFDYESYDPVKHQAFNEAKRSGKEFVDTISQRLTGMSWTYGNNHQFVPYMTINHRDSSNLPVAWAKWVLEAAVSSGKPLVAHNAPFEYQVTQMNMGGWELPATPYDTRLMASQCWEDEFLDLKTQSKRHLDFFQSTYAETLETVGAADMAECTAEQVLSYGADDSIAAAWLADLYWLVQVCEGTWQFSLDHDFEFIHEQSRSFLAGIKFDQERMQRLAKIDKEAGDKAMARLRELLTANCYEPNQAGAANLFNDLWAYEEQKLRIDDPEISAETLTAKRQALWEKIYYASVYVPFKQTVKSKDFKPTPKLLNKLFDLLGLPQIEKVTKKAVTEWMVEAQEHITGAETAGVDTRDMDQFLALLTEAVPNLLKREGEEYERFAAWCKEKLGLEDDTVSEGSELNINSPQQMQGMLYGMMALPIRIRSKVQPGSGRAKVGMHGAPGTDSDTVDMALADDVTDREGDWRYEALMNFKTVKRVSTANSLFYRPYRLWPHPADGMIHGSITNDGTVTRRPSGSSPNLLQLTKKDGGHFRSCVRPRLDDHVIISADFNGQELRILAAESGDPVMIDAYCGAERKDIHSLTAAAIFLDVVNTRYQELAEGVGTLVAADGSMSFTYEDYLALLNGADKAIAKAAKVVRKMAKGVNFLIAYMGGYTTLARRLLVPSEQAKRYMDATFDRYRRLAPWQQEVIEETRRLGYSYTAYGNRRHIGKAILSPNKEIAKRNERQAVNYRIQGCAADHLKRVLSEAKRRRLFTSHHAYMIAPVYDEIAASVPRAAALDYCLGLREIMELPIPGHAVPQVAEFSVSADSWGYQVEIKTDLQLPVIEAALEESLRVAAEKMDSLTSSEDDSDAALIAGIVEDIELELGTGVEIDYHG